MTPLGELLLARIAAQGPITIADYMADCLLHPKFGYYTTRDPFGAAGDFTTAPEISQMFGELIGLSLAQSWMDQGAPSRFTLAELGPGRGTLMADILRATRAVPGFHQAAQVHLVEASPVLRARQRETLGDHPATWCDHVSDLPDDPLWLVANEFFDALPIRQFERLDHGWAERMIMAEGSHLRMVLAPPLPLAHLDLRLDDTHPGDVVETCAPAWQIMHEIAQRVATKGAALIVDYGGWHSRGDTLQALRGHAPEDPLAHPGQADLTAHVDFEALAIAATNAGAVASALTPQGVFLERLGITQRARRLAETLRDQALDSHVAAHRRLTHPGEMGHLFKVLAIYPPNAACPPGCAT